MKRKINFTGDADTFQPPLFQLKKINREQLCGLPPIGRTDDEVRRIVLDCDGPLGLDFEFNPENDVIHVTGVASLKGAAAARYTPQTLRLIAEKAERGMRLVGHSVLGADRPQMEKALGQKTPLSWWSDTMIKHYLVSQDLCKVEKGQKQEDEAGGGLGFMGLWHMASLYTPLWNWKMCAGGGCDGTLCPVHDPLGYCAVDSYAGLACELELDKRIGYWKIPPEMVSGLHELTDLCIEMQKRGIRVSRDRIREINSDIEKAKERLFGHDGDNYAEFNPRSPKQGLDWFRENGIGLKSFSKGDIKSELEKQARRMGCAGSTFKETLEALEKPESGDLPKAVDALFRLYQYKDAGKGTKSWFDDRYIDRNGVIHPRFAVTGTSTGRLASSKPNFMNIASRGWGKVIKSCIVPHEDGNLIVDADFSNLELRMVLYLSGVDPNATVGHDPFLWLVQKSGGEFEKAAVDAGKPPRELAKITSHANSYLEGITLLSEAELGSAKIRDLVQRGALRIYLKRHGAPFDWSYCGKIVAFTGANLAERLYGNRSYESRAKALAVTEDLYFKNFPSIRRWQKNVLDFVQDNGYTRSVTGRILRLYGPPEDNAKVATAFHGQGTGADYVQQIMLQLRRLDGRIPLIQVHDSLVFEVPGSMDKKRIAEWMQPMFAETGMLPGFWCPGKVKFGPDYGNLAGIE